MNMFRCLYLVWPLISHHAGAADVPHRLAFAVMYTESACDHRALGTLDRDSLEDDSTHYKRRVKQAARGYFQVLPTVWIGRNHWMIENLTAKCGGNRLSDPQINACFGTRILRYYYVQCEQNWRCALGRYYGSPSPGYYNTVKYRLRQLHQLAERELPYAVSHLRKPQAQDRRRASTRYL